MSAPVVALIGRPNVGKSTLFNKLTRNRSALVANVPGLTRDRRYGLARFDNRDVTLVDTAGLPGDKTSLGTAMADQAWRAVTAADLSVHLCDGQEGLMLDDFVIIERLRSLSCPVLLVVNKIDGLNLDHILLEFSELGAGQPLAISASHSRGLQSLQAKVLECLFDLGVPATEEVKTPIAETAETVETAETTETVVRPDDEIAPEKMPPVALLSSPEALRVAMIGRPNVGKSTLVNRILEEDRLLVSDVPGTTHDSVFVPFERAGRLYTLIDTAGIRRRGKIHGAVEGFSVAQSLAVIRQAQVVLLLIDASEGLVEQDLHLLGQALQAGRALVLVVNKWDSLDKDRRLEVKTQLDRRLRFARYVQVRFISALKGYGVSSLYEALGEAAASAVQTLSTLQLTRALTEAVNQHPPPMVGGRRIKLRYAHLGGREPPVVIIHGNQTGAVPESYRRYLESSFRETFGLQGTPVRVEFRANKNPYESKKNTLTTHQFNRRKRLIEHRKQRQRRRGKK